MSARIEGAAELLAMLRNAKDEVNDKTRKIVSKGALNIKNDWRKKWTGFRHAPYLPAAVTYDVASEGDLISAEIGPDKAKRQGALGNLLEFGSVNNPPHPAGVPALDAEEPRFVQAMEDLAAELMGER